MFLKREADNGIEQYQYVSYEVQTIEECVNRLEGIANNPYSRHLLKFHQGWCKVGKNKIMELN